MLLRAMLEGEGKHAQVRSDQYSRERVIGTVDSFLLCWFTGSNFKYSALLITILTNTEV